MAKRRKKSRTGKLMRKGLKLGKRWYKKRQKEINAHNKRRERAANELMKIQAASAASKSMQRHGVTPDRKTARTAAKDPTTAKVRCGAKTLQDTPCRYYKPCRFHS